MYFFVKLVLQKNIFKSTKHVFKSTIKSNVNINVNINLAELLMSILNYLTLIS